jgi:c-di-GMP-binding flagellar brake protein YcgR
MRARTNTSSATSVPSSSSVSADPIDRRRSPRIRQRGKFDIRPILPDGVGPATTLVLYDISTGGLGALHSQPLRVGEQFQIPLTREAGDQPLSLVCTVVRCEKMDEDLYSVGFEFNSSVAAVDQASRQITGKPARRAPASGH